MRILRLLAQNLRAVPDGEYRFGSGDTEPARIVTVTGPGASGKTFLLETIAAAKEVAAPYGGTPNGASFVRWGQGSAKAIIEWWLDPQEMAFAGVSDPIQPCEVIFHKSKLPEADGDPGLLAVLQRYDHTPAIGKVDYFPVSRRFELDTLFGGSLPMEQKFLRLSRDPRKYRGILKHVRDIVLGRQDEAFERLRNLFGSLAPGHKFGGLDTVGIPEFILPDGEHAGFEALSSAAHQAFVFAGSICMTQLHNSVVLVDTPELFLGGGEAARRMQVLLDVSPSNQWIVATQDTGVIALAETRIELPSRVPQPFEEAP